MGHRFFTRERRDRLIVQLGSILLRLWFSTCRIRIVGRDVHNAFVKGEGPGVGATWHRNAIFLVWFYGKFRPMIMFSKSKDGALLAGFAKKVGVIPVRGSSSRGGRDAMREMLHHLRGPGSPKAATVLDGPQGPRFVAKKGMLVLARMSGAPLIPMMISARPAVTLKKAWDRTLIPLPFSRVIVIYRPPWQVPPDLDNDGLDRLCTEVESTLNAMMREADTMTGYIHRWPELYGRRCASNRQGENRSNGFPSS